MSRVFCRVGELKDLSSYPTWLQGVVQRTTGAKEQVANHELFVLMRDAKVPKAAMRKFLVGAWPTIEMFPQFMAMSLKKLNAGNSVGEDLARDYLIHNIRVEQKHAEHWVEWSKAEGVSLDELKRGDGIEGLAALAHWCWYVCDRSSLPVAMAATNYAVEGVTGEWSCLVCSEKTYASSLPEEMRGRATRWLRAHSHYDDTHPWEALEIIATLLGHDPDPRTIEQVERAIRSTYIYFRMGLDHALEWGYMQGTFDETASNEASLGALSAA